MATKKNLLRLIISSVVMLALSASITAIPTYALEDGAYTVSLTTSYVNPETGQTADGGTQIALGNSMIESVVGDSPYALVEQTNGKTYVTIGIGLMSNISSVNMTVQTSAGGGYQNVGITQTGSSTLNNDTCNHYRFEVVSLDLYISPILYVDPMGRNVQFYITLNMATAASGTGMYLSEMIPADTVQEEVVPESTEEVSSEAESAEEEVSSEIVVEGYTDPLEGASGLSIHKVTSSSTESTSSTAPIDTGSSPIPYIIGICVILVLGGGAAGFILWKRKGGWA